jgi:hypothetical protein
LKKRKEEVGGEWKGYWWRFEEVGVELREEERR